MQVSHRPEPLQLGNPSHLDYDMSSLTPTSATPTSQSGSASRRPPRKSTLTQQQKNQKRQRATQDQLITLEAEFNKNPTPNANVRERIAEEINMTERSVQIWFQNRRAKIKLIAKKSIENGEDCSDIPESMRQYLAAQAAEQGKSLGVLGHGLAGYGALSPEPSSTQKVFVHHFNCRSLSIGSWRRVGQNSMDLIIFYSPKKQCITYYIHNDSAGYKIEYPFSYIRSIELETLDGPNSQQNPAQKQGQIVIQLNHPPHFFMDSSNSGGFYPTGDFTADKQASQYLTHVLGGQAKTLATQLAKLTTLDAFINRHQQQLMGPPPLPQSINIFEHPNMAASAPVSPHIIRPASSNDIMPQPQFRLEPARGHGFHGHKRTRSRSVPVAIDFSQNPMPSFSFADDTNHLFAPAPQHSIGNQLRIDTTATGFLDYRSYPLSATTASPSEYASPPMMSSSLQADMSNGLSTPYSMSWVSPVMDPVNGPSVSPLSMAHDDMMANSPPMTGDMNEPFSLEQDLFTQEENLLTELYSKQLHFSGEPRIEDSEFDMQLMHFQPMSADLSPEPTSV